METTSETERRFPADQPVQTWRRTAHRITGCANPSQNTDWLWSDWVRIS